MKTKLFIRRGWKQSLEEFEQEVNDFMATVQVVGVQKQHLAVVKIWQYRLHY